MTKRVASVVATMLVALWLSGCGQKGPLIAVAPPGHAASAPTAAQTAPPVPPEPLGSVAPGTAPR